MLTWKVQVTFAAFYERVTSGFNISKETIFRTCSTNLFDEYRNDDGSAEAHEGRDKSWQSVWIIVEKGNTTKYRWKLHRRSLKCTTYKETKSAEDLQKDW